MKINNFSAAQKNIEKYFYITWRQLWQGVWEVLFLLNGTVVVLDGLLENNTILENKEHTTDTEGFTEHIFALSFLLGYQFVPRIKNLKDQQLWVTRNK